jgi:hypothetical protein
MNKNLIFSFIVFLLLVGCTFDSGVESEKGNRTAHQHRSLAQSTDTADTAESESTESEDFEDSELGYELEDFLGAVKMVPYSGWIAETDTESRSSLTDYFEFEYDSRQQIFYSFDAVRVYYEDGFSNLYLVKLNGRAFYYQTDWEKNVEYGSEHGSETGPGYIAITGKPNAYVTIGSVNDDGEVNLRLFASFISDDYHDYSKEIPIIHTYSDGTTERKDYSFSLGGLSAGGGSRTSCQGDFSDRTISGPNSCLTFISADGTFAGTYRDSIHSSDEESTSTTMRTVSWDLYPLEPVEEEVPIGNEEPLEESDYSAVIEEQSMYDDGFSKWITSTY